MNAFKATDEEFLEFITQLAPLEGEGLEHWTWEERRDFLNWCLDNDLLVVQDMRLVPNPTWVFTPGDREDGNDFSEVGGGTRDTTRAEQSVEV